jgi:hypothetical protein
MKGVLITQEGVLKAVEFDSSRKTVGDLLGSFYTDHRSLTWLNGRGSSIRGYKLVIFFHDTFGDNDVYNETASLISGVMIEGPAFLVDDNSTLTVAEVDKIIKMANSENKKPK